jgi:hypothetical protein
MQIGTDVVSGTHHIIDTRFLNVRLFTRISDAPSPLIISAAAFLDRVPGIGTLVIKTNRLDGRGFVERPRHAGLREARGDFRMARRALAAEKPCAAQEKEKLK